MPPDRLHAVPDGRPTRTAESILRDILSALTTTRAGADLTAETAIVHPVRGRSTTLALHWTNGETWLIDAYPADTE